jgi:preprotein translocase subunit SecF
MANISLNQTLMRSVNTSLVVLLPIGSLLFFGGQTLKDFAFALFVGVASGTYSSIFVAAPILALLKEREPRFQQIRQRAAVRSTKPGLKAAPASGRFPLAVGRRGQTNGEGDLPDGGVAPAAQAARAGTRTGGGTASSGSAARSGSRPPSGARKKSKPKPKRRRR